MDRARVLARIAVPLLLFASLSAGRDASAQQSAPPASPNIVLIMADDLGWETLESYGGTSYKPPTCASSPPQGCALITSVDYSGV